MEIKRKNDEFTQKNNLRNKEGIQSDLDQFFLFCDHCSNKTEHKLTKTSSKPNFASAKFTDNNNNNVAKPERNTNKNFATNHCKNCQHNFCFDCFETAHQAYDKRKHMAFEIYELLYKFNLFFNLI